MFYQAVVVVCVFVCLNEVNFSEEVEEVLFGYFLYFVIVLNVKNVDLFGILSEWIDKPILTLNKSYVKRIF